MENALDFGETCVSVCSLLFQKMYSFSKRNESTLFGNLVLILDNSVGCLSEVLLMGTVMTSPNETSRSENTDKNRHKTHQPLISQTVPTLPATPKPCVSKQEFLRSLSQAVKQ